MESNALSIAINSKDTMASQLLHHQFPSLTRFLIMFQPKNDLNGLITPIVSVWLFQRLLFCILPLLSLFTVHSLSPRPNPLPLGAPCRRSSRQHHGPLFLLTPLSTHPHYQLVPRPLVVKHRSLELLQRRAPLRHLAVEVFNLTSSRGQHHLVRLETKHLTSTPLPFFAKLHLRLCDRRSLKAPARPSSPGTSPTINTRIARHYRATAQSGATLQGPTAPKRYPIFLPSKVQKPQSEQPPLTHTNT